MIHFWIKTNDSELNITGGTIEENYTLQMNDEMAVLTPWTGCIGHQRSQVWFIPSSGFRYLTGILDKYWSTRLTSSTRGPVVKSGDVGPEVRLSCPTVSERKKKEAEMQYDVVLGSCMLTEPWFCSGAGQCRRR